MIPTELPFEREFRVFLQSTGFSFVDHCDDYKRLDFSIAFSEGKFRVDVKEKRQNYTVSNWPSLDCPQEFLFILYDLAARKILAYAPNSGLLIRNNLSHSYYFLNVVDLFMMPRIRANRKIHKYQEKVKGKWLIDLRNGILCENLDQAVISMEHYLKNKNEIFTNQLECYGDYYGEEICSGGITRVAGHWDVDVENTR